MGAMPFGPADRAKLLNELSEGGSYAVFDRRGRRIGLFIDVVSPTEIAIRHDGAFVWRRRTVPLDAVATVSPRERTIVLDVDRAALGGGEHALAPEPARDGDASTEAPWEERLRPYIRAEPDSEPPPQEGADEHLLFVGTPAGYAIVVRSGDAPTPRELVVLDEPAETEFRVTKVARSPLANDGRRCAYLEQASRAN